MDDIASIIRITPAEQVLSQSLYELLDPLRETAEHIFHYQNHRVPCKYIEAYIIC